MTPESLAEEFKRIDSENSRIISKEAMLDFLNSGKCGDIGESDFEALWAVLDADKSGTVDFLEFCAFMSQCHEDYNAARMDRGSIAERASIRFSVAEKSARRLSQQLSVRGGLSDVKAIAEEEGEGGVGSDEEGNIGDEEEKR